MSLICEDFIQKDIPKQSVKFDPSQLFEMFTKFYNSFGPYCLCGFNSLPIKKKIELWINLDEGSEISYL